MKYFEIFKLEDGVGAFEEKSFGAASPRGKKEVGSRRVIGPLRSGKLLRSKRRSVHNALDIDRDCEMDDFSMFFMLPLFARRLVFACVLKSCHLALANFRLQ